MSKLPVLIIFCALARGALGLQQADGDAADVYRLPRVSQPESYDLRFAPNFNGTDSTFDAVASIVIRVNETTNVVTLNLKDLTVNTVTVTDVTGEKHISLAVNRTEYRTRNEQFEIYTNRIVPKGRKCLVKISYRGKIRTDLTGLYLSSYEENNATKWLAVTQFEPTYARRAFPCYDEPSYKATYNISVVKQKNQIALSNMPINKTESNDNTTEVVYFEKTPPMSSYLVAIFVGEFVTNKPESDIRVYTHKDYLNQTKYVETEALKHLKALENYTKINYMLPKMDLLAIPDFNFGAMENWGLNTYQEYYMLVPEESKTIMKMHSTAVVQHEFTHQWFGDLVTCSWWDYLWLNEGFARYFQFFGTKMVKTSWPMEELFLINAHQVSLAYDQTPRHPITSSVKTTEEIESIFDTITYSKAASVLRMLKYLVTEELFQLSLQTYLNSHKENVAEPDNLYSAFDNVLYENVNGTVLNVKEFMSSWTLQSGYPVLNIKKNETANKFSVIQNRFFMNAEYQQTNDTSLWPIGLTYTTEKSKNFTYADPSAWTNKTSKSTLIPAPRESGWYIFNIQSTGFYRVNYDIDNWMALIKQLKKSPADIHVLNRAQLVDDAFTLAKAGQLNYSVPLHLSKYLKNEEDTAPWYSAMNSLSYLTQRMPRNGDRYANFKDHVSKLAETIFKRLDDLVSKGNTEFSVKIGWDSFSSWACSLENEYCTKTALQYFNKWQAGEKISPDIKDAAFCVGVKKSNDSNTFYRMFDLYKNTKTISEKTSAKSALGCSTNRTQLTEYINHILDGPNGPIKPKDYKSVITAISRTPLGLDVLYEFLSTNLNRTLNGLSDGESIVAHIYSTLATKITNDDEIKKLREFKNSSTVPDSVRSSFEVSFETVNENLAWFDAYSDAISQWSLENKEVEPTTTQPTSTVSISTVSGTAVTIKSTGTTTKTPELMSGATSNVQNCFAVLLFTAAFTLFIKKDVLC